MYLSNVFSSCECSPFRCTQKLGPSHYISWLSLKASLTNLTTVTRLYCCEHHNKACIVGIMRTWCTVEPDLESCRWWKTSPSQQATCISPNAKGRCYTPMPFFTLGCCEVKVRVALIYPIAEQALATFFLSSFWFWALTCPDFLTYLFLRTYVGFYTA